jgi:hypothetical protein
MEEEPIVGAVYEDADGRAFEVIDFDEDEATVEIEYEDGTVEELDLDAWYDLDVQRVESDEDDLEEDIEEETVDDDDSLDDEDEDLDEDEDE